MKEAEKRRDAVPVASICDRRTGNRVGWLYRWNDGTYGRLWIGDPVEDVVFEDLPDIEGSS